jgi:hypothetical protein
MTNQTLIALPKRSSTVNRTPVIIDSIEPLEGCEGTIVTLKGSGFPAYNPTRNNCVVIGGMGACARAEADSTSTELKVRIGPVAKAKEGNIRMWPGTGLDVHTESISSGDTSLLFSETAIFRNGAPETSQQINFKLTKASPNTYAGYCEKSGVSNIDLAGYENSSVMRVSFPENFSVPNGAVVDVCIVLKEPTLAIDFTAEISADQNNSEDCLRAIAKSIVVNSNFVGEKVLADVARNQQTGELELYVTKPYLSEGMVTIHFNCDNAQ